MSGTRAGGVRAAATNKLRYGPNYYRQLGKKGGEVSRGGGFAANSQLARTAGRMGGQVSRKTEGQRDTCGYCGREYGTGAGLATHIKFKHKETSK